ncbi:unnamed protein product [Closterium sp. Naga37s-1]|nr:unnamed protein product [Closterium sp. Naga37s-1]
MIVLSFPLSLSLPSLPLPPHSPRTSIQTCSELDFHPMIVLSKLDFNSEEESKMVKEVRSGGRWCKEVWSGAMWCKEVRSGAMWCKEDEIREYHALRLSLAEKERRLKAEVLRPDRCLHFLQPGRLLSLFKFELKICSRVLKRLGHIDADGGVQLKGRAACVVTTGDELLVTELMLEGAFNSMDPHQLVAVASCFLPSEKLNEEQPVSADLKPYYNTLREAAQDIARVQQEKIEVDEEGYVDQFRPTLMNVFYQWSKVRG